MGPRGGGATAPAGRARAGAGPCYKREPMARDAHEGPPTTAREFTSALDRLRREYAEESANIASYECVDCAACASCMFCRECTTCYRCTYCEGCEDCSNCTHCRGCTNCHGSSHCTDSERCVGSAYLELCTNCSDCNYCFGCVGLQKKDFHILNVPYDRSTYFDAVKKLKRELGLV